MIPHPIPRAPHAAIPVDTTAFAVLGMRGNPVFAAFPFVPFSRAARFKRAARMLPRAAQAMTAAIAVARRMS